MASKFVHLHTHSEFSLLDGANRIDRLIRRAKELEMPSLALTDHGVMSGCFGFYKAAKKEGIAPILGMEAYVAPAARGDKKPTTHLGKPYYHLVLLAQNEQGYKNLVKLSSLAFMEGFYHKPRVDRELLAKYSEGIAVLSACFQGEIAQALSSGRLHAAEEAAAWYANTFQDRYYLEVQAHDSEGQDDLNKGIFGLADRIGLPVIATNDVHFMMPEDHGAHDTLICIGMGKDKHDPNRLHYDKGLYFKSAADMAERFASRPDVLANTLKVAEESHLVFEKRYHVPAFPLPEDQPDIRTEDDLLRKLSYEGAKGRYGEDLPKDVMDRLEYELDVITRLGYSGYFLIVSDFIAEARRRNIEVGPGRGSAAGSIVAYSTGITDLCPLKFDLLFERFLNPDRATMPDIDVDFAPEGRAEIIEYCKDKYGHDAVGQITTFGTMKARAVIKDVGRVLGFSPAETDRIAKLIPNAPNHSLTIAEAVEEIPEIRAMAESMGQRERELIRFSMALEGLSRHASVHAAGVVIAPGPLHDYVPVSIQKDQVVSQYDMNHLEEAGMLKMDFLGLTTLTVIREAMDIVEKRRGVAVDFDRADLDDPAVYELFRKGRTAGVFQMESPLATDKLRAMQPDRFEDIVAASALIRPGPLDAGMTEHFIKRKRGDEKIDYPHPLLKEVLEPTLGIITYQEQVMRVAQILAGYTLAEADILRKAVGKKDAALIQKEIARFREKAVERGVDSDTAARISAMVETFGRYGFNRSHSAAYGIVTFRTAYLKAYYPAEFMAALLSSEMGNKDKVAEYMGEARSMGIAVARPDVNESDAKFKVDGPPEASVIRVGLNAILNVGIDLSFRIVAEREENGRYGDFFDFVRRTQPLGLNRRSLEAMIGAGALDGFGHRAQLNAACDTALAEAQRAQKEAATGQADLFSMMGGDDSTVKSQMHTLPNVPPMDPRRLLDLERDLIGLYVSDHPMSSYEPQAALIRTHRLADLKTSTDGHVVAAGVVTRAETKPMQRGGIMGKATIEDLSGFLNVVCFDWDRFGSQFSPGEVVVLSGSMSRRNADREDAQPELIVEESMPLSVAIADGRLSVVLHFQPGEIAAKGERVQQVSKVFSNPDYEGRATVYFMDGASDDRIRARSLVRPCEGLLSDLRRILGEDAVSLMSNPEYAAPKPKKSRSFARR